MLILNFFYNFFFFVESNAMQLQHLLTHTRIQNKTKIKEKLIPSHNFANRCSKQRHNIWISPILARETALKF